MSSTGRQNKRIPFPEIKASAIFARYLEKTIKEELDNRLSMFISLKNTYCYYHGVGVIIPRENLPKQEITFKSYYSPQEILINAILHNQFEILAVFINNTLNDLAIKHKQLLQQRLEEGVKEVGNEVDANAHSTFAEAYLESIKRVEFHINKETGEPEQPIFWGHPHVVSKIIELLKHQGPDFDRQLQEVIDQKKTEALNKEKDRIAKFKHRQL